MIEFKILQQMIRFVLKILDMMFVAPTVELETSLHRLFM